MRNSPDLEIELVKHFVAALWSDFFAIVSTWTNDDDNNDDTRKSGQSQEDRQKVTA